MLPAWVCLSFLNAVMCTKLILSYRNIGEPYHCQRSWRRTIRWLHWLPCRLPRCQLVDRKFDSSLALVTFYTNDNSKVSRERPIERCLECGNVVKLNYTGPETDAHARKYIPYENHFTRTSP